MSTVEPPTPPVCALKALQEAIDGVEGLQRFRGGCGTVGGAVNDRTDEVLAQLRELHRRYIGTCPAYEA